MANVILSGDELGRPMAPPPEPVKTLYDAYSKALKDPDLIAEVNKSRLDMEPSTGEEIEAIIKEVMDQPPEVIALVTKLIEQVSCGLAKHREALQAPI